MSADPFEGRREAMAQEYRDLDLDALIANTAITAIYCLEPECALHRALSNEARLPGSVLKLYENGRLDEFFAARAGEAVIIVVHHGCVVAYNQGWNTHALQAQLWADVEESCRSFAEAHGCALEFNVNEDGMALEHMP